jgi:hypothetical protein
MLKFNLVFATLFFITGCSLFGFGERYTEYGNWSIEQGELVDLNIEEDALAHEYWQFIYPLLPNDLVDQYLVAFAIFTDGAGNELGAIDQIDESNTLFRLNIDINDVKIFSQNDAERIDANHTLVHEFGHMMTLNNQQIELAVNEADHTRYITEEGQARADSYLNLFVQAFWNEALLSEWQTIKTMDDPRAYEESVYDFHQHNHDRFVTEYSSEGPEEDIAESWTFFVFTDKPTGNTVREQKVRFFYQFPELVDYRKSIRENLSIIPDDYMNVAM